MLYHHGRPAEAEKEWREAIRIKPDYAEAHYNLGVALDDQGRAAEAEKEYREAIRIKPDYAEAHSCLGALLAAQGRAAEAEKEYREAIRIKPDFAKGHYNLGVALGAQGRPAEAEKEYREAIRIEPDYAEAHCNLGLVLIGKGQFAEALTYCRRGHELGSRQPGWTYPSAQWVREAERLAALDAALPTVLRGQAGPADASAALEFANLCQLPCKHRYVAAVRFYEEAFAARPELAGDVQSGNRYNAACAAALAGCGQGDDAPAADADRARLRAQALGWLRADLGAWRACWRSRARTARSWPSNSGTGAKTPTWPGCATTRPLPRCPRRRPRNGKPFGRISRRRWPRRPTPRRKGRGRISRSR